MRRVNFQTGVLPKVRQVVPRQHTKLEAERLANISQKFEEGMAPRGSSANPPPRVQKTPKEKIELSARSPQRPRPQNSAEAVWRAHIAEVRRVYFQSTLEAYEKAEAASTRAREAREAREAAAAAEPASESPALNADAQSAEALTAPTVESALLHATVQPRTPEELEALRLKRTHNRLLTEQRVLEAQAADLIALYQQSEQFITSEAQLSERIAAQFKPQPSSGSHNPDQAPVQFKAMEKNNEMLMEAFRANELDLARSGGVVLNMTDKAEPAVMPALKHVLHK